MADNIDDFRALLSKPDAFLLSVEGDARNPIVVWVANMSNLEAELERLCEKTSVPKEALGKLVEHVREMYSYLKPGFTMVVHCDHEKLHLDGYNAERMEQFLKDSFPTTVEAFEHNTKDLSEYRNLPKSTEVH